MLCFEILQPDIYVGHLRLQEPITSLTDLILGFYCIFAFWILSKERKKSKAFDNLKIHLLLLGIAVIIGGTVGHGFQYAFSLAWKVPGWYISMIAVMFMERSAIEYIKEEINHRLHKGLLIFNFLELLLIMGITSYSLDFFWVELHSVYGLLLIVFPCHLYSYHKTKDKASKKMLYGISVLVIAIFVFNYPIIIDKWFTNYDFAHVLMLLSIVFFFKAGKQFK